MNPVTVVAPPALEGQSTRFTGANGSLDTENNVPEGTGHSHNPLAYHPRWKLTYPHKKLLLAAVQLRRVPLHCKLWQQRFRAICPLAWMSNSPLAQTLSERHRGALRHQGSHKGRRQGAPGEQDAPSTSDTTQCRTAHARASRLKLHRHVTYSCVSSVVKGTKSKVVRDCKACSASLAQTRSPFMELSCVSILYLISLQSSPLPSFLPRLVLTLALVGYDALTMHLIAKPNLNLQAPYIVPGIQFQSAYAVHNEQQQGVHLACPPVINSS